MDNSPGRVISRQPTSSGLVKPGGSQTPKPQPIQTAVTKDDPLNAFSAGSEAAADKGDARRNPFTGLKLTEDSPAAKIAPAAKIGLPRKARPIPVDKPVVAAEAPVAARKPVHKKNPHADKLRRIAERRGLKGLKGFCPVVLRDQRDLRDARPEFHSKFQGAIYYFSSKAAKAAFDVAPEKYAPVMDGRDVIQLAAGKNSTIGSLDHAVWFKDRLYLFESLATMQVFVRAPKKFAVQSD